MTTSSPPARFDAPHSDSWRFGPSSSHNGNADSDGLPHRSPEWVGVYTRGLIYRVAQACDGLKPTPLAARLNLHPETVRRYLNGQRPSPEFLAAICRETGVSAEWLLLGEGEMYRRGHS